MGFSEGEGDRPIGRPWTGRRARKQHPREQLNEIERREAKDAVLSTAVLITSFGCGVPRPQLPVIQALGKA